MNKNALLFFLAVILCIAAAGGFYLVFDKLNNLETRISNLELASEFARRLNETPAPQATSAAPTAEAATGTSQNSSQTSAAIPTAIIFNTTSSPLLAPQTKLTITAESVGKETDGTVTVSIKVFSSDAGGYSALEPRDLFEIINLDGNAQRAFKTTGQFQSIPPKSAVLGSLLFKIEPSQNSIILQTGSGEDIKFYEFDFLKKSYRETVLG